MLGATENDHDERPFPVSKDDSRNRYVTSVPVMVMTRLTSASSGSAGTNTSASTAPYDSAASSARFSSSSTIPSSTDISYDSHANSMVSAQRPLQDIPVPPAPRSRGWSIKNAGRNFSFASKQKNELPVEPLPQRRPSPTTIQSTTTTPGRRERAMTASTTSTATPPRLLEGELAFGDSDLENFGNMFDSIDQRSNRASAKLVRMATGSSICDTNILQDLLPLPGSAAESPASPNLSPLPPPLGICRTREAASPPHSFASHDSREELIGSHSPSHPQNAANPSSPVRRKVLPSSEGVSALQAPSSLPQENDFDTQRQIPPLLAKSPSPIQDEDARLLARSVRRDSSQPNSYFNTMHNFEPARPNGEQDDNWDTEELLFSASSPNRPNVSRTGPSKASGSSPLRQWNADGADRSSLNSGRVGAQFEANTPAKANANRDTDDESEQDQQAANPRSKQETPVAAYRQTMIKEPGESSSGPSSKSTLESGRVNSMSTPELSRMSHLTVSHSAKSSSADEEDEDVPLGILAAHGFPNKNKPPSRLQTSQLHANLRSSTPFSAPPASLSGESRAGSRGTLPVFARNLPQDPYSGASMVSPPNRGQLWTGNHSFGGLPPGQVHPSGLVGVIAGEERARAMRRGSPNQQVNHDLMPGQHPGMMGRSQTMGNVTAMNGYPSPGMPGGVYPQVLSPGDQAQIQMAQQMNQMMQMQMQFMQQMAQMQQSGQMGQMPQMPQSGVVGMPNFMGMPGDMNNPNQRPFSMPLPDSSRQNGRAMSLTPEMTGQWNRNSSYAPSLAPSERNTIGMASRYRPVSIVPDSNKSVNDRASTFTFGTPHQWSQNNEQGRLSPSNTNTTVRPTSISALGKSSATPDDEDDDQGWADMKKKRDKKKSMWKMKRSDNSGV